jgi:hypothetical protein
VSRTDTCVAKPEVCHTAALRTRLWTNAVLPNTFVFRFRNHRGKLCAGSSNVSFEDNPDLRFVVVFGPDYTCTDCPNPGEIRCNGVCVNALTDSANCGYCGYDCSFYYMSSSCVEGVCV